MKKILSPTSINSTERIFDKNDLRHLFELGPSQQCKMLESINQNLDDIGSGDTTSGIRSILENHDAVIGISSHNVAKKGELIDLVNETSLENIRPSEESILPMSKKSNSKQVLATSRKTTAGETRHSAIPLRASTKYNVMRGSKQRMKGSKV